MKSQEASSSASRCKYDVFLSFRGEDTRKNFTYSLYTALVDAGFPTFRDDDCIERGEEIKSELEKAIQESWISIIVFSENYASSTWCLDELVQINNLRTFGHIVLPVFYGVDPSDVRKQNGSFQEAFARHEEKFKSVTDELEKEKLKVKVRTWRAALTEVANLAGVNLQDPEVDGYDAKLIKNIIKEVGDKLRRRMLLNIDTHLVGMHSRVKDIQLWLEDVESNVGIVAICGMGGIGKTTIAKFLYNHNFSRFEGSSFIADVSKVSREKGGLLLLQRQFLADISKRRKVKLNNTHEGTSMIVDVLRRKKVLVILDDVDEVDQIDELVGMQNHLFQGSKIIITTRHEGLVRASTFCEVHRLKNLSDKESLELLSLHAFAKYCPDAGHEKVSKRAVTYCGGIPLAIKVLGSSLFRKCKDVWESQLDKLKANPNKRVVEILRISYDSLEDDYDKRLFLRLACLFVGSNKDFIVSILEGCELFPVVGINNLVDRNLISFNGRNKLVMHNLLQQMGREIVYQESPSEPGRRSILWDYEVAIDVLRENAGTSKIEGLKLDAYACKGFGDNRKCSYDEFLGKPLLPNFSFPQPRDPDFLNPEAFKAVAFAKMNKLKLLLLNRIHITGPYKNFPKGLRWLCWRGFLLKSIPHDFPLEGLVCLDMKYSRLKYVWEGTKFLRWLKILNLSHSYLLVKTPDVSALPNLESLVLKGCISLVEVHESIGSLERLVLLNLKGCKNLRSLPKSICMLKKLETLIISGCLNLDGLPTKMENMESLTMLMVDKIALDQSVSNNGQANAVLSSIWSCLLLKGCTSLVEIHESSGSLEGLVLLNSKDSKNLRNLPKSICIPKDLETLIIFGCFNLDGLSMENSGSFELKQHNRIALDQSVSKNGQANAVLSFIWSWRLKPRESPKFLWHSFADSLLELSLRRCNLSDDNFPRDLSSLSSLERLDLSGNPFSSLPDFIRGLPKLEFLYLEQCQRLRISWHSFPDSLLDLGLTNCNLSDHDFPRGLSNLCSLEMLDLSGNLFSSLPDFIGGLAKLESLFLDDCPRLRKLDHVPQLKHFSFGDNVEEVSFLIPHRPTDTCHVGACNHPETLGLFKVESIENVEAEIVHNLGLPNLQYIGNPTVKLMGPFYDLIQRGFLLQVCYETHVINAYIRGTNVPPSFNFKVVGSSINFIMPSYNLNNSRIQGLNVCSVYGHSTAPRYFQMLHTVISNRTKGLVWSHRPWFIGIAEDGGDTMYMSYWKFGNHLEDGDEVNISVYEEAESVQVKEVGVRLVYKEEQEEMSPQSAYEDDMPHQFCQFGNMVPGIVFPHQQDTKIFLLGGHFPGCRFCNQLYPGISTNAGYSFFEFSYTALMRGNPFYASEDLTR